MLTQLQIRNLAIINELELQFREGMTVLTGETGAGKSILIDALGLVLGDRAESSVIRTGADRAEIAAVFKIDDNPGIASLLEEQALEMEGNEVLVRRVVSTDGPSRAFINGSPVTLQVLKVLGENLIDIHGQHAHQSLMKRDTQRNLLDAFAGHQALLDEVRRHYRDWRRATDNLAAMSGNDRDHDAQLALLQYQLQELEALSPVDGEFEMLEENYKRLVNASRLLEATQTAVNLLEEDEQSLQAGITRVMRELQDVQRYDPALDKVMEFLDNARIQLDEGTDELKSYLDRLELDPEKLAQTENRLNDLHDMARKHHIQPEHLTEHLQALQERHKLMVNNQEAVAQWLKQQEQSLTHYKSAAGKLRDSREQAALTMARAVSKQLKRLGMPQGRIVVEVTSSGNEVPLPFGNDVIDFLVSVNPGQDPQPVRKIASGGELSRISLAIQVIVKNDKGVPTFIFDEVDAGIGGAIAEVVGNLLHDLAADHQVFCVTHLPQVAAQGDHHLLVEKRSGKTSTRTTVTELDKDARVEEIARMLGGLKISDQTRAHAREMLDHQV